MKPIVLYLVLSIFIVGCTSGAGEKAINYNFKQGLAEMKFTFLSNAPPEKIYPDSAFTMVLEIENQAAYDATNLDISILGLDEKYFRLTETEQHLDTLAGRSLTLPAGEKQFIEFTGQSGQLFQNAEEYPAPYFVQATYTSALDFTDTLCINPGFYTVYDAGCKVQDRMTYSGQGAPLAVTELEEIVHPNSGLELRLKVQNRGRGKVHFINLERAQLGSQEMNCEFQNTADNPRSIELRTEQQEATLICRTFLRDQRSYTTTAAVSFNYDYEVRQEQQLKLVK